MTQATAHRKTRKTTRWGTFLLVFLLCFSLALLLRRADVAADSMRKGLALCSRVIVPSLFPFMVLSELLVTSGAGQFLTSPLSPFFEKALGLSKGGCCAVVLGLVCGFPVGARCAILAYEQGSIGRRECERAIACSSIPSSAFVISTVGTILWGNGRLGVFFYLTTVFWALLSGILLYVLQKREKSEPQIQLPKSSAKVHFTAGIFPTAVRNATLNTLLICAYVVFFSTLTGAVEVILGRFAANEITHAILSVILELSGGVSVAAKLADRHLALLLSGVALGWSGISIHCQMLSLTDGHNLSVRPYLAAKLIQAAGCALTFALVALKTTAIQ